MSKTKTKTKLGDLSIETCVRKRKLPRTAFKKGNTMGFKAGEGSPNPGGKPKADRDRLIGKSVIRYLQDHAPDDACKAHGLPPHSSWGQILAKRLIRFALNGEQWAYSEILALSEVKHARLDVFGGFDSEVGEQNGKTFRLEFVSSNGDGRPCAEFLARHPEFAADGKTIEGEAARPTLPTFTE